MGAQARSAHGTTIEHQPAGDSTFRNIGEVKDVTLPALTRDVIDTTTHSDKVDSAIPGGILHLGELEFEVNWNPDDGDNTTFSSTLRESSRSHQRLQDSVVDGTIDGFRVTHPGGRTTVFSGFVTSVSEEAPVNDLSMVSVSVKPINAIQYNTPGFVVLTSLQMGTGTDNSRYEYNSTTATNDHIRATLSEPSGDLSTTAGDYKFSFQSKSPGLEWTALATGSTDQDAASATATAAYDDYTLLESDVGNRIRAKVVYTDPSSKTEKTVFSPASPEIVEGS